jgi:hypothetical protein
MKHLKLLLIIALVMISACDRKWKNTETSMIRGVIIAKERGLPGRGESKIYVSGNGQTIAIEIPITNWGEFYVGDSIIVVIQQLEKVSK